MILLVQFMYIFVFSYTCVQRCDIKIILYCGLRFIKSFKNHYCRWCLPLLIPDVLIDNNLPVRPRAILKYVDHKLWQSGEVILAILWGLQRYKTVAHTKQQEGRGVSL